MTTLMEAHKAAVEAARNDCALSETEIKVLRAEATFARLCAEREAELARLRARVRELEDELASAITASLCKSSDLLEFRARVADVLQRAAKATRDERFSDDFQSEIHKAITALLRELEP